MARLTNAEKVLQTYSLDEILELNDLTEADLLDLLIENGLIELPEVMPLDVDT